MKDNSMAAPEEEKNASIAGEDARQSLSRRSFLQSSSAALLIAGLDRLTPAYAQRLTRRASLVTGATPSGAAQAVIDLAIRETPIEIAGRRASATTINGTIPGPLLRFRQGEEALIRVTNGMREDTSLHWHGIIVPNAMDGVPGVNFPGIRPGETFHYRFPLDQNGTYWYHSHSGLQEQTGVYGPLIIDPSELEPFQYEREFVVVLSDWSFENPYAVLDKIKKQSTYYQYNRQTVGDFFREVDELGWRVAIRDRAAWAKMRMSPVDLSDITGATYTYLMNGLAPDTNWTALFRPGERVRLRFINAGAGSNFDVRIPGLPMTVVQVSGQYIQPVMADEFRIGIAETYDVIVTPNGEQAHTIFAESSDRTGYARGTLTPRAGMTAPVPKLRPRPLLTMMDMGMIMDEMGTDMPEMGAHGGMPGMNMPAAPATPAPMVGGFRAPGTLPEPTKHGPSNHGPGNAAVPEITRSRLGEPGTGLGDDGWRVLTYADLRSLERRPDALQPPVREIELHLTGNMERYMWSINGKKYSEAPEPIPITRGERIRLTMVNDTMMPHPMHLHGMWMELENGALGEIPRVHTILVKPAERVSVLTTPHEDGPWAFHCHVLLHMEMGMFRVVQVNGPPVAARSDA
jgi:CopA family copper-resistance protein